METQMWGGSITRQDLLQSISLLRILNEVPVLPGQNVPETDVESARCLSISREKEIAGNLAFLSALSYNNKRVMAVCVEEDCDKNEITIRVAANTGDLSNVVEGFKRIAKVLEQAARRENPRSEDKKELLSQVVAIDIRKILTRLRSKHATSPKFRERTPLITQLSAAIQASSSEFTSGMHGTGMDKLVALQVLFERLERMSDIASRMNEAQELVGNIVKEAHEFSMATNLIAALEHSKIDPNLKQYLPEAMTKLGRYYAVACELVSAAKERENHVFQKVHVEPCQVLVPADIEESFLGTRLLGVAPTLGYLPASRTGELADTLQQRMVEIAGHRAVHAEIQLLFFYELQPESPRPRIICSNKSACYLCNLFFQIHGGFCIPKTHGRIYDKWILPDWLVIPSGRQRELSIILESFKYTLDGRIKEVSMSKRKPYNHPNESNLQSPADYSSTELSAPLAQSSRSILLPRAVRFQEMKSITKLPGDAVLPSTQPRVPPEPLKPPHVTGTADVHPETFTALDTVKLANNKRENKSSLDLMSLVTLRQKHLPYSQILTLATPSDPAHLSIRAV